MIDFYPGQQIVCVDASAPPGYILADLDGLTEREVYTVRSFGEDEDGDITVRLVEIIRPIREEDNDIEIGYLASRFRPLVKTDISVFKALLAPTPTKVRLLAEASA